MKVLFLLPESPCPPDLGPKHHTMGVLRVAAERLEAHVAGFYRGERGRARWDALREALPGLRVEAVFPEAEGRPRALAGLRSLALLRPFVLRGFQSPSFRNWLATHLRSARYDVVHVDDFRLAHVWPILEGTPSVLVPYDAFSLKFLRAFRTARSAKRKLVEYYGHRAFLRMERRVYRHFNLVAPVSRIDAEWLRRLDPDLRLRVMEIPVGDKYLDQATPGRPTSERPHVIVTGTFSAEGVARGGAAFLRHVVPGLRAAVPGVRVTIWGRDPAPEMSAALRETAGVDTLGWVDDTAYASDYVTMLRSGWVYAYPQECGAGIQTKVQQAMALGLPVVARPVSLDPLGVESGTHAIACTTEEAMTEAIVRLLRDDASRARIGEAAHRHMREHFGLKTLQAKLTAIYEEISA